MTAADSPRLPRVLLRAGLATASALVLAVAAAGPAAAEDETGFAPPDDAAVAPGAMTFTGPERAMCTANFVFSDGETVYLGQAAHCAGTGESSETDGCTSDSLPLGTPVEIEGAERPGTLAYSSWLSMQESGETDPDLCRYNDFALVALDPADVARTTPTMPFYGGPTGVDPDGTQPGEVVYGYGNSSLRQGVTALKPKTGTSTGTSGGGRTHTVVTVPPGVPGDSGSGYLSADGAALGLLSTLNVAPDAGTNGITDLRSALDYANGPGGHDGELRLVEGERPFTPQPLPVDLGQGA
ncbi:serine protease [Pseudonocardia nantongensis]|uniref:serine protease n=1 Tax=Pseudonocardia nantongensis TaxID=1181885 RepID=UPI00397D62D2